MSDALIKAEFTKKLREMKIGELAILRAMISDIIEEKGNAIPYDVGDTVYTIWDDADEKHLWKGEVIALKHTRASIRFDDEPHKIWNVPFSFVRKVVRHGKVTFDESVS